MNLGDKSVYQIYIKSFKDSNGDGIGDINGITSKLDYIKGLGVDYIWITPFFLSPQEDNGYDIADYYKVDPMYGTMADLDNLITSAKNIGIELMFDMVFNHCSTDNVWFKRALEGDEKYKDYFIFKKGKKENNTPPTNWKSKFGGSAWEYVPNLDEYYLHLFHRTQADLNWDNPEVRAECANIVNFWIKKGIKGFRFDVINLISKPKEYLDDDDGDGSRFYTDGAKMHEYLRELNQVSFGKYNDIVTVGEMPSSDLENCVKYSNPKNKELSMIFDFKHLRVDYVPGNKWDNQAFDIKRLKDNLFGWQLAMSKAGGWNALFWNNHDQPRIVSRIGNDSEQYRVKSAQSLATLMYLLLGTPYIYQGEEIGMTNAYFSDISHYRDVESINVYSDLLNEGYSEKTTLEKIQAHSRDNSRTPMQWNGEELSGFSTTKPWLELNNNYQTINAEKDLNSEDSIYEYYHKILQLRKDNKLIQNGRVEELFHNDTDIIGYLRTDGQQQIKVICNLSDKELPNEFFRDGELLIGNYEDSNAKQTTIRPYEAVVIKEK